MRETERQSPVVPLFRDRGLYLVLLLALILRTYHLAYPPWDYHNWRQTLTLMVARDFARHGFRLLHPRVAWIGAGGPAAPSYFSGELSVQSVLAALLYQFFGESDAAARLIVILFSLLGIYFLYEILDRRAGRQAARLGALIYAMLPYPLFFGRVFMPEVPALALALGGISLLDRWTDSRRWSTLLLAASLLGLAFLQQLFVVFVAVPAVYLFAQAYGGRVFKQREPYLFAAVAGLPGLAWYTHAAELSRASGFSIMPLADFGVHLGRWSDVGFVAEILRSLVLEAFSPLGTLLVVLGLCWPSRGRVAWTFRLWVGAGALLIVSMPDTLAVNRYYLLMLAPGGAALAGVALAALWVRPRLRPLVALFLALFAADSLHTTLPLYQPDRAPHDLGVLLSRLTVPSDPIATESGGNPNVLYFAGRRGWIDADYSLARAEQLVQQGARYFATMHPRNEPESREWLRTLDGRFLRLTSDDAPWAIYSLDALPTPLHEIPRGEIQNPYPVNFNGQIEMLGLSFRELLVWPSAYEITYYWQCLKKADRDLAVFVHITTPEGKTVYQQDHWPLSGHSRTSQWIVGDVLRERYVVVLPENLPAGRYQIRVGWWEPPRGSRLRIVSAGASDGEDRAIVVDVEVRRPPRYRWFNVDY